MSFRNQSEANIANAQKSTGPKSEAAKLRTRLNAYKHGLTGQIHLVTAAENEAFELHCAGIRESLQPVGALETELAQGIAEDHWRLRRARAIETAIFAGGQLGMMGHLGGNEFDNPAKVLEEEALLKAQTWVVKSDNFQLLALYEQRIHRAIAKSMAELRTLRAERKAAREQALEELQLLAQLAFSKGEAYDPAADFPPEIVNNGFEFSSVGVRVLIARNQRLTEARDCAKTRCTTKQTVPSPGLPLAAAA